MYEEKVDLFSSNSCYLRELQRDPRDRTHCLTGWFNCATNSSAVVTSAVQLTYANATKFCEQKNSTLCKFFIWVLTD